MSPAASRRSGSAHTAMLVRPVLPNAAGALRPKGPNRLLPEHVAGTPPAGCESVGDVGAQPSAFFRRRAQRLRPHHPDTVELPAALQDLGEPRHLVRRRDEVGRRHDAGEEQRRVRERDDLGHGAADRHLERFRDRRGQRLAGDMARRHQRHVVLGDTEIRPAEAERVEDLGGQDFADGLTCCGRNDFAHQRAPRHPVVDVHKAGPVYRLQLAELAARVFGVVHPSRFGRGPVANGTPALWVITCRIVVRSLPWLV